MFSPLPLFNSLANGSVILESTCIGDMLHAPGFVLEAEGDTVTLDLSPRLSPPQTQKASMGAVRDVNSGVRGPRHEAQCNSLLAG